MNRALTVQTETSRSEKCIREDNFQEMYSVLGDFEAQEKIRKANPKAQHCHLLKDHSPGFCECLSYEIKDFENRVYPVGSRCPNNPYTHTELHGTLREHQTMLNWANHLRHKIMFNQVPLIERMAPEEFVGYSIVASKMQAERQQALFL